MTTRFLEFLTDPALGASVVVLGSILLSILSLIPQVAKAGFTPERMLFGSASMVGVNLLGSLVFKIFFDKHGKPSDVVPLADIPPVTPESEVPPVLVLYATTTGTSKLLAESYSRLYANNASCLDLATFNEDNLAKVKEAIFFISTISEGNVPLESVNFFKAIEECTTDFRYGTGAFANLHFAVFAIGNALYPKQHFCTAGKRLDKWLHKLGATRIRPIGLGDDSLDLYAQVDLWMGKNQPIAAVAEEGSVVAAAGEACGNSSCSSEEEEESEYENDEDKWNNALINQNEPLLDDVEDLDVVAHFAPKQPSAVTEMVTPMQRKNLTKQGYKLIGSHSAVKLCRWTKAAIRGRGFCYKRTFYGINSHQCMEATPSLACANKCVFCWRTHTNPVGTEWRWKTDEPTEIVSQACAEHVKMMKTLRGIEGALPERLKESQTIRHCALSLVGEPIMYPRINEVLQGLHDRGISSFLVTNAQFPQAIVDLNPVTQLYVSVDASTKQALKEIDRPLFGDFWERFQASLAALSKVNGRTVFRLTLVKDRNVGTAEALDGYAKLIAESKPDLVEIKGVTFCGKSNASDLTMKDVPWHFEVRQFSIDLCARIQHFSTTPNDYGVACEHAHSVCVLLARKDKFWVEEERAWYTWIDFDRFLVLQEEWRTNGKPFNAMDFRAKTPEWAVFGAKEEGFDPADTRFRKVRKHKASAAVAITEQEEEE